MVTETIKFVASCVRYNYSVAENERKKDSMSPILDVLPTMIANFAENARVSTGFRLLKRCLRHALDPKAFALENTTAHMQKLPLLQMN